MHHTLLTARRRGTGIAALSAALMLLLVAFRLGLEGQPLFVDYDTAPGRAAPVAAVLLSGDMGLAAGLGERMAERLQQVGIPTVGINTPAFFLKPRDADATARLVARAARRSLTAHPGAHLVLIGQSFGADLLPSAVNRLPADLRRRLQLVALVVPSNAVYYRISAGEFFGFGTPDARAEDEAGAIHDVPLLCVRGASERDSLCPQLRGPRVEQVVLPGGHMLHHRADRLSAVLLGAIRSSRMTELS